MKHFIVKLFVVVAIALFALPRLYAQDTTITIYGKKFAPGVIVKINGRLVDSTNIKRDSAQPSRILYVKFPLSWLNKPPASLLAGGKDAGASLNSNEVGNIVEVGNPGSATTTYTIYTKPKAARIALLDRTNGTTIQSSRKITDTPLGDSILLSFVIRYENVDGVLNINKFALDSSSMHTNDLNMFDIFDSTGTSVLTTKMLKGSGSLKFTLRFRGLSVGLKKIRLVLSMSGKTTITAQRYEISGFCIREFKILAGYTLKSTQSFHVYDTLITRNPRQLLTQIVDTLNAILERTHLLSTTPDKFTETRFRLVTAPFQVTYQEQSPDPHLHIDIDNLSQITTLRTIPEIYDTLRKYNADCTLLVTNNDAKPYRAIGSECVTNSIPQFIIADIKYIDMQILNRINNAGTSQNFESIRSFLYTEAWKNKLPMMMGLEDFFYDKLLLQDLRNTINTK